MAAVVRLTSSVWAVTVRLAGEDAVMELLDKPAFVATLRSFIATESPKVAAVEGVVLPVLSGESGLAAIPKLPAMAVASAPSMAESDHELDRLETVRLLTVEDVLLPELSKSRFKAIEPGNTIFVPLPIPTERLIAPAVSKAPLVSLLRLIARPGPVILSPLMLLLVSRLIWFAARAPAMVN
jgi:hypothetical protein